jgi:hypothetical protein
MRTLTLLTAALAALAATAPSAIGQTVRIDASSTNSTAVAIGVGNSATTHTGVMGTDNITGFADLNARSRNAAALALGLYSNASLNVGGVGSSARARSVRTNASVNNAYALSIAPGSARATVGAVCSVRGGSVRTNAHASGLVVLNAGFWTPVRRTVNIGSVGRNCQ